MLEREWSRHFTNEVAKEVHEWTDETAKSFLIGFWNLDRKDYVTYGRELKERILASHLKILNAGRAYHGLYFFEIEGQKSQFQNFISLSSDVVSVEKPSDSINRLPAAPELGGRPRSLRNRYRATILDRDLASTVGTHLSPSYLLEKKIEKYLEGLVSKEESSQALQNWLMPLSSLPMMRRIQSRLTSKTLRRFRGSWSFSELSNFLILTDFKNEVVHEVFREISYQWDLSNASPLELDVFLTSPMGKELNSLLPSGNLSLELRAIHNRVLTPLERRLRFLRIQALVRNDQAVSPWELDVIETAFIAYFPEELTDVVSRILSHPLKSEGEEALVRRALIERPYQTLSPEHRSRWKHLVVEPTLSQASFGERWTPSEWSDFTRFSGIVDPEIERWALHQAARFHPIQAVWLRCKSLLYKLVSTGERVPG